MFVKEAYEKRLKKEVHFCLKIGRIIHPSFSNKKEQATKNRFDKEW